MCGRSAVSQRLLRLVSGQRGGSLGGTAGGRQGAAAGRRPPGLCSSPRGLLASSLYRQDWGRDRAPKATHRHGPLARDFSLDSGAGFCFTVSAGGRVSSVSLGSVGPGHREALSTGTTGVHRLPWPLSRPDGEPGVSGSAWRPGASAGVASHSACTGRRVLLGPCPAPPAASPWSPR